jgi:hypothetical protein
MAVLDFLSITPENPSPLHLLYFALIAENFSFSFIFAVL